LSKLLHQRSELSGLGWSFIDADADTDDDDDKGAQTSQTFEKIPPADTNPDTCDFRQEEFRITQDNFEIQRHPVILSTPVG
jgi:hypothetical protein